MKRRTLDIRKKYYKKDFLVDKTKLPEILKSSKVTVFLEEESHYDNGESEFVYRMVVKDNFAE